MLHYYKCTDIKNPVNTWNSNSSFAYQLLKQWTMPYNVDKNVGYIIRNYVHNHKFYSVEIWVCAITSCGSRNVPNVYDMLVNIDGI